MFYWYNEDPVHYMGIRSNGEGEDSRDIREVYFQEKMNALCYVLDRQLSLSFDDMIREAAKVMNYTRMGTNVTAAFESAVQSALSRKLIEIGQNEKYRLTAEGIAYVEEAKKKSNE